MKTETPQTENVPAVVQPPLVRQSSEIEEIEDRLIAYRKKHFAVEVSPSRWSPRGEINLSITSNGNQWQSISLMPDELERVIAALNPFLSNAGGMARELAAQDSASKSNSPAVSG